MKIASKIPGMPNCAFVTIVRSTHQFSVFLTVFMHLDCSIFPAVCCFHALFMIFCSESRDEINLIRFGISHVSSVFRMSIWLMSDGLAMKIHELHFADRRVCEIHETLEESCNILTGLVFIDQLHKRLNANGKLKKRSNEPGTSRSSKSKDDRNVSCHLFLRIRYR